MRKPARLSGESTLLQVMSPDGTSIALHIIGNYNAATMRYLAAFATFDANCMEEDEAKAAQDLPVQPEGGE